MGSGPNGPEKPSRPPGFDPPKASRTATAVDGSGPGACCAGAGAALPVGHGSRAGAAGVTGRPPQAGGLAAAMRSVESIRRIGIGRADISEASAEIVMGR